VARTNPLGKIKDVALGTLRHPVGTAGKAVEQAKGTAAIGRMVAGQVTRAAASVAVGTVGGVAKRATGSGTAPAAPTPASARATRGDQPNLRPVPSVNEPAHTPATPARRTRKAAQPVAPSVAQPAAESMKNHGDQLEPVKKAVKQTPAKKAPATKTAAPEAPAAKKAAAKTPAKKTPAKKTPAKKTAAKKTAAKKTATAEDGLIAKKTPAKKLAAQGLDDVTPADVAKVAKKTPTKKTTPVKAVDTGAAPENTTAKKTAKKAAKKAAPRTASEVANEEGPEYTTPVGTTAAGESALPNTDLQQPGTEPLMDPATVKSVRSETETMQRAADPDKG
jgi:hypothetical protein